MRRLRGVGVGAGYFARYQYEAWARIPEVELTAVCDIDSPKASSTAATYGILAYYTDWRHMIEVEKPDFIDIITPPPTHLELCAWAASRGIHIICQKPLAPTYEESAAIVNSATDAGVRLMVHENWRWQPWYREVKKVQEAGIIGSFTHLYFRMRTGDGWGENAYLDRQPFFREYSRLLVYETGVHFIDTFRYLLGEIAEVFANLRRLNPAIRGEDTGQIFFRFESGATGILDANRYNEVESPAPRYTFGELRIDAMGGHLTLDTAANIRLKPLGQEGRFLDYPHSDVSFAGDCVYALQRHFVDCMISGREFESNGTDYLKTLRVVDAVYESAATGAPVKIG